MGLGTNKVSHLPMASHGTYASDTVTQVDTSIDLRYKVATGRETAKFCICVLLWCYLRDGPMDSGP